MGIIEYLRLEARQRVDPTGSRWSLFANDSPNRLNTGSLLRVTYRSTLNGPLQVMLGSLIAIRRNPGDPTFIIKSVIDEVAVEQIFCVFSPLLESIEVLKTLSTPTQKKLYDLSDGTIAALQKAIQKKLLLETAKSNNLTKQKSTGI